jgi:hypothetical protein
LAVVGKGRPSAAGGPGSILAAIFGLSDKMGDALFSLMCTVALDFGAVIALLTAELRNVEEHKPEPEAVTLSLINLSPEPRAHSEVDEIGPRLPERPRPKLAATTRRPIGAVLDFLHDGLDITTGPRTEMADAYMGYATRCKVKGLRPLSVARFVDEMEALCKRFGIRIVAEDGSNYLMDVRLSTRCGTAQGG